MKFNKTATRVFAMIIMTVMCFTLFSFSTSAVSLDQKGSITLTVLDKENKKPISGARFRIFRFASAYAVGNSITYVYTDEFKNCGIDMGNFSDAYLPIHLATYADFIGIPSEEKSSDNSGKVVFDNLICGAYLVAPVEINEGYLNPSPFIVTIPMKDETKNSWIYNIDATPKIEGDKDEVDEKTFISVKKNWQSTSRTPDSVTVSLVKDGKIFDSVVLSAANNWYFRWDDLDKNHSWNVIETDVPDGYTVSYTTSQMTVVITNTDTDYEEETTTNPDDTTVPDGEDTTAESTTSPDGDTTTTDTDTTSPSGGTTKPTGPTKPTKPTESTTKPDKLIHTGQLNWPVPVFAIAGLLLFSIGWAMLNLGKKDEETA